MHSTTAGVVIKQQAWFPALEFRSAEGRSKSFDSCGAALAAAPAAPAATSRFASPEPYTPKHLAERILTSKSAQGERKQVPCSSPTYRVATAPASSRNAPDLERQALCQRRWWPQGDSNLTDWLVQPTLRTRCYRFSPTLAVSLTVPTTRRRDSAPHLLGGLGRSGRRATSVKHRLFLPEVCAVRRRDAQGHW